MGLRACLEALDHTPKPQNSRAPPKSLSPKLSTLNPVPDSVYGICGCGLQVVLQWTDAAHDDVDQKPKPPTLWRARQ